VLEKIQKSIKLNRRFLAEQKQTLQTCKIVPPLDIKCVINVNCKNTALFMNSNCVNSQGN